MYRCSTCIMHNNVFMQVQWSLLIVIGAKSVPSISQQRVENSHTSSFNSHTSASNTTSKPTNPLTRWPEKQPKTLTQRSGERRGRFEEGKPKSSSFRSVAEPGRPVTESMLYNLVAAAAFPAAPAGMVLDVMASTSGADLRAHPMQATVAGEVCVSLLFMCMCL